jgi:hypothetical protein
MVKTSKHLCKSVFVISVVFQGGSVVVEFPRQIWYSNRKEA